MTTVVNLRDDFYDVKISRPGQFGNPFLIGRDGTRSVANAEGQATWLFLCPVALSRRRAEGTS